jgi:hypothetical protein
MSISRFISAQANLRSAQVKPRSGGRSQNEARIRQATRGIKDMFRKDGAL